MENQLDEIKVDLKLEIIINEISSDFENRMAELRVDFKKEMEEFKNLLIKHPKVSVLSIFLKLL